MTRTGLAALATGLSALVLGLVLRWVAFDLIGVGLLITVLAGLVIVTRPSVLSIERAIQPDRVPKGSPAVAVLTVTNRGRRRTSATVASQPFGSGEVHAALPRLRRGERGLRTYRLPTRQRGILDIGPLELRRRDPFDLFRTARRYGGTDRIWVYPRVLPLRTLPTGRIRNLEGPTSETSQLGSVSFHTLRDYVADDDARLVHWPSTARAGHLVVKHNVDTSLPFSIVLLDLQPASYTPETFEEAVDVAASAVAAASQGVAPVQLRLTDGTVIGGPRQRGTTELIDHLTTVVSGGTGSLRTALTALRRAQGTSLVVVTGRLEEGDLPYVAALRRRFERVVVVSMSSGPPASIAGVRIITAADADKVSAAWNGLTHA